VGEGEEEGKEREKPERNERETRERERREREQIFLERERERGKKREKRAGPLHHDVLARLLRARDAALHRLTLLHAEPRRVLEETPRALRLAHALLKRVLVHARPEFLRLRRRGTAPMTSPREQHADDVTTRKAR
jgi:hypothetical protein